MDDTSRRVGEYPIDDRPAAELAAGNGGSVRVPIERAQESTPPDADTDRRASEIRHEIDHTRAEMTETIEAIQAKLNPRNIVANATERVKAATTERVREMAGTASDTAQDVMNQTRDTAGGIVQAVQQNPVPAALIGLGAAWLLMNHSGSNAARDVRVYRAAPRQNRPYAQEGDGIIGRMQRNPIPAVLAGVGLGWLMYSGRDKQRDGSDGYISGGGRWSGNGPDQRWNQGSGRDAAEGLASSVSASASRIASRARDYVGDTGQELQYQGGRAQNQLQRMLEDSPLLVGAGALMIGAAFGLAVPETEIENQWMGETRDTVRDTVMERTQEIAQNATAQVQQAAAGLTDAVTKQSS
jgi:hypothetical protein